MAGQVVITSRTIVIYNSHTSTRSPFLYNSFEKKTWYSNVQQFQQHQQNKQLSLSSNYYSQDFMIYDDGNPGPGFGQNNNTGVYETLRQKI